MASKKSFRRRGGDAEEDDEEEDTGPALLLRPATRPGVGAGSSKKMGAGSTGSSGRAASAPLPSSFGGGGKKAAMLSFEEDEEDGEEGGMQALKSSNGKDKRRRKKKAFASRSLEQAMGEMEGEAPTTKASGLSSGGGGGGEYTAEKLAALRKGQNFQVSTKSAKATAERKGARVTFLAPDGSELPPGVEEMGDEELDKEEVERLKREKRYKMRRALAAAGEAGMQGSEDEREEEADEDFIHLDGERRGTGRRHVEEARLGAPEQDVQVEDDWESEMIRRGARKPAAAAAAAVAAKNGVLSASLDRLAMGGGVGVGVGAAPAFKMVEEVLKELKLTRERVDEAHEQDGRAASKAQGELEAARGAALKLQGEFDETAARFQFFQDTREYVSSLCGCLREKEGMIRELEGAMAQTRRDAAERRWRRRAEDQEDALEEVQAQGALSSLQGYSPTVVTALRGGGQGREAAVPEVEVDEFGRSRSVVEEAMRERRRRDRLARREKLLRRLEQGQPRQGGGRQDTAEAEARVSGGEESEAEKEQTRERRRKLLEAAAVIFEDAAEEYADVNLVARRFEAWKRLHRRDYQTAYVSAALPQLFEPLVRVEMARWDPLALEEDGETGEGHVALEEFPWYERLFAFGQQQQQQQGPGDGSNDGTKVGQEQEGEDPDDRLVPQLVEKVAVELLRQLLREVYDPLSSRQTERGVAAVQTVLIYEPGKHAMEELLQAPVNRLQQAIQSLCVPLLHPLQASEDAVAFQRRQLFRAVKLYANVGKWHPVAPRVLAPLALGGLLEGCIAPALGNRLELQDDGRALLETVGTLETLLAATPPTLLLEKSAPQLKQTIALLDRIGQHQQQQQQQAVAAPVLSTITRLRAGFGNGGSKKSN